MNEENTQEPSAEDEAPPIPLPSNALPRYRCHKVVEAMKITRVVEHTIEGRMRWMLLDDEGHRVDVGADWMERLPGPFDSPLGGYYVRYEGGYESWSPPGAFEGGYTRIEGRPLEEMTPVEMLLANLMASHYYDILWRGYHSSQGVEINREMTFLSHVLDFYGIPHEETGMWHDAFSEMARSANIEKMSVANFTQAFLAKVRESGHAAPSGERAH